MGKESSVREIIFITIGFLMSMVHWSLCAVYFVALIFYLQQGIIGCIKGLLIMTTRGILSTAVSSAMAGPVQMVKWGMIFLFSFYILFYALYYYEKRMLLKNVKTLLAVFALYVIFTSFISSSYPVVSVFKVISYAIPFYAVAAGVSATSQKVDWMMWLYHILTPIIMLCAVTIPFSRFRIVNDSFQGAINHPNLMGIFGAIYIGVVLYVYTYGKAKRKKVALVLLALTYVMIYLSESRTGMFSAVILLVIHLIMLSGKSQFKAGLILAAIVFFSGFYFSSNPEVYTDIAAEVERFVYKRDTDDILESRRGQVDNSQEKYDAHPIIGAGFSVPYEEGVKDYQFSMSLTNEPGNIFLAVLGDCGIVGSILFWGYMLYILWHTQRKKWMLCLLPVVVSMGEMAFFATNNIAIYYYLLYGVCLGYDEGE